MNIIGGCCGTRPEFIREIKDKISDYRYSNIKRTPKKRNRLETPIAENLFRQKLENSKKPIAVEFDPPKSLDMKKYMENVTTLASAGADAITIADCPVARVRVDASLTAYKIKNEIGIDPIVHMTYLDINTRLSTCVVFCLGT